MPTTVADGPFGNVTSLFPDGWEQAMEPPPAAGEAWDAPVDLGESRTRPLFPVDTLPGWIGGMVAAVAEETQTPADLAGCLALAVVAAAAGGKATVRIRGRWTEPVNIYTVVALDPGNRKSAVFDLMTKPLLTVEESLVEISKIRITEAETALKLAKATADKAAHRATNAEPDQREALTREAIALAQQAAAITVPCETQLIADNATQESLATLLADQGGRIAIMSPEGGIFDIIAGLYSGSANMEIFLKGHAGDMVRVNRQGRPSQHVQRPAVTMGLAIQPEVLDAIANVKGADGRGLLARYLYSVPESLVGSRTVEPEPLPDHVADNYSARLAALAMALVDRDEPAVLTLTPEANAVMLAYQKVTEARLGKGGALRSILKWASKRDGAVARLAGLLHLAEHPTDGWDRPIEAGTLAAATRLGDYFTAHALHVFDAMGADPGRDAARTLLDHLRANPMPAFTKRDLFRAVPRADFRTISDLGPALDLLEEHGWLRQQTPPPRSARGGRPPSPRYHLHPALTRYQG
ncbi:YfjI family protein [Streptomyces sp. NRRL B-24484]|uniref:YfjI family protein n=1 Tax=Streptomyces sp. NRRL B-24484 TaxID=1463833 RepID=UPI000997F5B6|nr:YfjI family protein [Streptomyces sp. NRRL B-24484]